MVAANWLDDQFEANRARLRAVAFRMLGSPSEADDAVQESWLRLHRVEPSAIQNVAGWLTSVCARVCLDILRSRASRREDLLDADVPEPLADAATDPKDQARIADSVGIALLLVLETLSPPERVVFVLHDLFDVSFEQIAPVVGRTAPTVRQLASRARRRVRGAAAPSDHDLERNKAIVVAFLAAARDGEFEALLRLLDPNVVFRSDDAAAQMGSPGEARGANAVANIFAGRAKAAQAVLLDERPGLVWSAGDGPRVAFVFRCEREVVAFIEAVADLHALERMEIAPL